MKNKKDIIKRFERGEKMVDITQDYGMNYSSIGKFLKTRFIFWSMLKVVPLCSLQLLIREDLQSYLKISFQTFKI